jgi:hypothetical protein
MGAMEIHDIHQYHPVPLAAVTPNVLLFQNRSIKGRDLALVLINPATSTPYTNPLSVNSYGYHYFF